MDKVYQCNRSKGLVFSVSFRPRHESTPKPHYSFCISCVASTVEFHPPWHLGEPVCGLYTWSETAVKLSQLKALAKRITSHQKICILL